MPTKPDLRDSFQNLIARYNALHSDFTAQAKSRNAGAATAQAVRLVRTLLTDTRHHLGPAHAVKALPFLPKNDALTVAEIALILVEARAVLQEHAKALGHDQPRAKSALTREDTVKVVRRLAELTMLGVEWGVDVRMRAIAAGEDPEEAYTIFHTEFYKRIYHGRPELTEEELQRPAPRLNRDEHGNVIDSWRD